MSNYDAFLEEKVIIDDLMNRGYTITSAQGTLDGDVVEFENKTLSDKETILLTNPDSRKYFMALYMKQQKLVTK
ncbi:hypothetical protein ACW2QC_06185 [Virgibacillus sp. FSP13]